MYALKTILVADYRLLCCFVVNRGMTAWRFKRQSYCVSCCYLVVNRGIDRDDSDCAGEESDSIGDRDRRVTLHIARSDIMEFRQAFTSVCTQTGACTESSAMADNS